MTTARSLDVDASASRLKALPAGSFRLLDVRTGGPYLPDPGAVNVPLDRFGVIVRPGQASSPPAAEGGQGGATSTSRSEA